MSDLPTGWAEAKLGAVATARMGKTILSKELVASGLPVFSASVGPEPWGYVDDRSTVFSRGTLVISARGTIGDVKLPEHDLFVSTQTTIALEPSSAVVPSFLRKQLSAFDWPSVTATTAIPMLTIGKLDEIEVRVPPITEQRRIVAKLDALTARTARARADLDRIPALANRYREAVLKKTFAGELFADGCGIWKSLTLGDLGKWGSGGTPKSGRLEYYGGAIPWVRSGDLSDGPVASHVVTITDVGLANSSAKWVPKGAVLLAMYGATIGKVGVTTYPVTTNQAVASLQCHQSLVSPSFAFWLLRSLKPAFVGAGQGGAQPNISQTIIKSWPVLIPSLDQQEQVVRGLEQAFSDIDRLTAEAAAARRLLDRLDQAVLNKAFRGELVPQDPNDEPASVLLDRIRAERAAGPTTKQGRKAAVPA